MLDQLQDEEPQLVRIYIYMYKERQRERDLNIYVDIYMIYPARGELFSCLTNCRTRCGYTYIYI